MEEDEGGVTPEGGVGVDGLGRTTALGAVEHDAHEKQASLLLLKEPMMGAVAAMSPKAVAPRTVPVAIAVPPADATAAAPGSPPRAGAGATGHTHTWAQVDVTSKDAFQRVVLEGPEVLSGESKVACRLLTRALAMREKHAYKKDPYYMGACKAEDYLAFVPASSPLPPRDEIGSPVASSPTTHAPALKVGDALVSEQTGKTYPPGLFYRRRREPPFQPFRVAVPGKVGYRVKMVRGVYHVYPPRPEAAGGAADCRERGTSLGLDLDGLAPPAVPHPASSRTSLGWDGEGDDAFDGGDCDCEGPSLCPTTAWGEWARDYVELLGIVASPPARTFSYRRLQLLTMRFDMHRLMNRDREASEQKAVPHRDFFNCRRVDTHVHHSACMNQKHLLRFIKSKLKKEADTVVIQRDGKALTLAQVFTSLNLTAYDLSLDVLDMHADWSVAHRFDKFNCKYNPLGQSRLREIFLKTDNLIHGRYLAELTREVFDDVESTKYSLAEYRLSIYGRGRDEWRKLAGWVVGNALASPNVRWMIQVPRLYDSMRAAGQVTTFGDMLVNIFAPLMEVTLNPQVDPTLHQFLSQVGGFDSVDDESKGEESSHGHAFIDLPPPNEWSFPEQPPYAYQTYYMAANLAVLNQLRRSRGFTEFSFRPHAGEAGSPDHLAATFLTAESIAHGINLRRAPVLEYLYYLAQIGIAVAPLSNNRLFLELAKNPFPSFLARGLNVSLSTDDPLMLHLTREPLMEEYAVAMQVWHLSAADTCEIARNSCLASCFEHPFLSHWLGPDYRLPGPDGNAIDRTNVPHIRLQYRLETLQAEFDLLQEGSRVAPGPGLALSKQSSTALFASARAAHPQIVPHSPGSGRPLYRVVRRGDGGAHEREGSREKEAPAQRGGGGGMAHLSLGSSQFKGGSKEQESPAHALVQGMAHLSLGDAWAGKA